MAEEQLEDLGYLDDILSQMAEDTKPREKKGEVDFGLAFLGTSKFTFRVFLDMNRKLYHESNVYSGTVKIPNAEKPGETVEKKVRVLQVEKDRDTLRHYKKDLNWKYAARWQINFLAVIVSVETTDNEKYFKPGPQILVTPNKKFLDALKSQLEYIGKKNKVLLAQMLDPAFATQPFVCDYVHGKEGNCKIVLDSLGDNIEIPEAIQKLIKSEDIRQSYCPQDNNENDIHMALLDESWSKLLTAKQGVVDPDESSDDSGKATDSAPVSSSTESSSAPAETKPSSGAVDDALADALGKF